MNSHSNSSLARSQRGMTLVEILVVIVLLGVMMGVLAKGLFGQADSAKAQTNMLKMEKLRQSIQQYKIQYNAYPSKLEDLVTPSGDAKRTGQLFTPLAAADDLKDVWGYDYMYRSENNGRSFALSSLGSDGIQGGDGAKQDVTFGPQ